MLRYFIFIEYGLLPDLRVGVLISASQIPSMIPRNCMTISLQKLFKAQRRRYHGICDLGRHT